MSFFAIGDIQGCYDGFRQLLERIRFNPDEDTVWLAGDLVNRGDDSLSTLRFIAGNPAFRVVLGNHDLHLLAIAYGDHSPRRKDTISDVLDAPDSGELLHWLSRQPLLITEKDRGGRALAMAHAGIPPQWTLAKAAALAEEVSEAVRHAADDPGSDHFLRHLYGNDADLWSESLSGTSRLQCITNYFTRMRFLDSGCRLDFSQNDAAGSAPANLSPWFSFRRTDDARILFGHWAALEGEAQSSYAIALDAGYVWGGHMKAVNVDSITEQGDYVAVEVAAPLESGGGT